MRWELGTSRIVRGGEDGTQVICYGIGIFVSFVRVYQSFGRIFLAAIDKCSDTSLYGISIDSSRSAADSVR